MEGEELDAFEAAVREVTELANNKVRISLRRKLTQAEKDALDASASSGGVGINDVMPGEELYKIRVPAASLDTPIMPGDVVTIKVFRGVVA